MPHRMDVQRIYFTDLAKLSKNELKALKHQYAENPASLLDMAEEEAALVDERIASFYRSHLDDSGMDGYVVGISGGIDSALVAMLTVGAVTADRVFGVMLPTEMTTQADLDDAQRVINALGIKHNDSQLFRDEAASLIESLRDLGERTDDSSQEKMKRGNILARLRMIVLRDFAKAKNYLVAGTSNASERMLGYMTLAGDGLGAIDNEGIDALFKTSVRKLAAYLGVPASIITKAPSAELWEGQTDEDEIGMTYAHADQIFVGNLLGCSTEEIVAAVRDSAIDAAAVEQLLKRVQKNAYKSQMPRAAVLY